MISKGERIIFLDSGKDLKLKASRRPKCHELLGLRAVCKEEISNKLPFGKFKETRLFERRLSKIFFKITAISHFQSFKECVLGMNINKV